MVESSKIMLILFSTSVPENKNFSYICCNPIASFELKNGILNIEMPNGKTSSENITNETDIPQRIHDFSQKFKCSFK